jgi:PAS domain-containing protein
MAWQIGLIATGVACVGLVLALALALGGGAPATRALAPQAAALPRAICRSAVDIFPTRATSRPLGDALDAMAGRIAATCNAFTPTKSARSRGSESAGRRYLHVDERGILLDVNARVCALTQRTRAESSAVRFSDFITRTEASAAAEMIRASVAPAHPTYASGGCVCPGDVYCPVEVNCDATPDGRLQGITRDITERSAWKTAAARWPAAGGRGAREWALGRWP